jgi:hypothetical protein
MLPNLCVGVFCTAPLAEMERTMIAWEAWIGLYGMILMLTGSVLANKWWVRRFQFQHGVTADTSSKWIGLLAIRSISFVSAIGLVLCALEILLRY